MPHTPSRYLISLFCALFVVPVTRSQEPGDLPKDTRALYVRALARISASAEAGDLLGVGSPTSLIGRIRLDDSLYVFDPFPFSRDGPRWHAPAGDSGEHPERAIDFYSAVAIFPFGKSYSPTLRDLASPPDPRGILFFSVIKDHALLAELFPFDRGRRNYMAYSFDTPSVKFLILFDASGNIAEVLTVYLTR